MMKLWTGTGSVLCKQEQGRHHVNEQHRHEEGNSLFAENVGYMLSMFAEALILIVSAVAPEDKTLLSAIVEKT